MAQAKSSAAQTQIAIGQQQMRVFEQIAQSAQFVVQQAAESRRQAANIWQGMVTTAQNAKELEINTYLKERELDLRGQQIAVDARLADVNIGLKQAGLALEERRVMVAEDGLNIQRQKMEEADKNKDYISMASKLGAAALSKGRLEYSAVDNRYKSLVDQKSKLTAAERLTLGPTIDKELSTLTEKRSLIEREIQKGEMYQLEALSVAKGAEPGFVISIPFSRPSNNTSTSNSSMPAGEGGMDTSNPLFPEPDDSVRNQANQYLNDLGVGSLPQSSNNTSTTSNGPDRLIGQQPVAEYYAPPSRLQGGDINRLNSTEPAIDPFDPEFQASNNIKPAKPTFTRDQIVGVLGTIEADKVELEAPQVIALADDETKAYLKGVRSEIEDDFLRTYGSMTNFDNANRPDDAIDYIKNTMLDYARNGGNQYGIAALQRQAKSAITNFRAELLTAKDDSGKPKYGFIDGKPGPEFIAALETKYNEWVTNRGQKVQESEQAQKENAVKTGILPNGALNLDMASKAFDESSLTMDSLKSFDFRKSAANASAREAANKEIDQFNTFEKDFIIRSGNNMNDLKGSFATLIKNNWQKLSDAPQGEIDPNSGVRFDVPEDTVNSFVQNKIKEALMNRSQAFWMWREIKGLK